MLKVKIFSLPYASSTATHLASVKANRNRLTTLYKPVLDEELITIIISNLPKDYNGFISNVSINNKLATITFNELEGLLLQEEQIYLRLGETSTSKPSATLIINHKGKQVKILNVPKYFANMNLNSNDKGTNIICHYCGKHL